MFSGENPVSFQTDLTIYNKHNIHAYNWINTQFHDSLICLDYSRGQKISTTMLFEIFNLFAGTFL